MLKGSATGATRADIITQAKDAAITYFGIKCVIVELTNEQTQFQYTGELCNPVKETITGYTADWGAEISHRIERRTYGPDKCVTCGKEFWE